MALPAELLDIVAGFVDHEDQLSLALVSKSFAYSVRRNLYRVVFLGSPSVAFQCCQTLVGVPAIAQLVKRLAIGYDRPSDPWTREQCDSVRTALHSLSHLRILSIGTVDPMHAEHILPDCVIPKLFDFNTTLKLDTSLVAFLNRHSSTLTHVRLYRRHDYLIQRPPFPPLILPNIINLEGDTVYVPHAARNVSDLRVASLTWSGLDEDVDFTIKDFSVSCKNTLNALRCSRRSWNCDLIRSISIHLPHITKLEVDNILIEDAFPSQDILTEISAVLPLFDRLQVLVLRCIIPGEPHPAGARMDADFETAALMGRSNLSLDLITLPHGVQWKRISDTWLPDPRNDKGWLWISDRLRRKHMYPKLLERVEDYIRQIQNTASPPWILEESDFPADPKLTWSLFRQMGREHGSVFDEEEL